MTTPDILTHRAAAYAARRAIRNGDPEAYIRTRKIMNKALVRQYVQVLPPLLAAHCIAKAETLAMDQIIGAD